MIELFKKSAWLPLIFLAWTVFGLPAGAGEVARAPSPTRWAIDAGYGMRLWDATGEDPEQREYEEKARRGLILGGDVAVFPLPSFGIGFAYYRFQSSTSDPDLAFYNGVRGESVDEYLIEYVGPSLYFKRDFRRLVALGQVGAGIVYYDNQHEASYYPGVYQDVAPGFFGSVSMDYKLTSWLALGVTARILYGKTANLSYNGMTDLDIPTISLTRADLAGGIRFYP